MISPRFRSAGTDLASFTLTSIPSKALEMDRWFVFLCVVLRLSGLALINNSHWSYLPGSFFYHLSSHGSVHHVFSDSFFLLWYTRLWCSFSYFCSFPTHLRREDSLLLPLHRLELFPPSFYQKRDFVLSRPLIFTCHTCMPIKYRTKRLSILCLNDWLFSDH